ncbi:transmembrane protein 71 isoform 1-T2 [Menidia menidia]
MSFSFSGAVTSSPIKRRLRSNCCQSPDLSLLSSDSCYVCYPSPGGAGCCCRRSPRLLTNGYYELTANSFCWDREGRPELSPCRPNRSYKENPVRVFRRRRRPRGSLLSRLTETCQSWLDDTVLRGVFGPARGLDLDLDQDLVLDLDQDLVLDRDLDLDRDLVPLDGSWSCLNSTELEDGFRYGDPAEAPPPPGKEAPPPPGTEAPPPLGKKPPPTLGKEALRPLGKKPPPPLGEEAPPPMGTEAPPPMGTEAPPPPGTEAPPPRAWPLQEDICSETCRPRVAQTLGVLTEAPPPSPFHRAPPDQKGWTMKALLLLLFILLFLTGSALFSGSLWSGVAAAAVALGAACIPGGGRRRARTEDISSQNE